MSNDADDLGRYVDSELAAAEARSMVRALVRIMQASYLASVEKGPYDGARWLGSALLALAALPTGPATADVYAAEAAIFMPECGLTEAVARWAADPGSAE